MKFNFLEGFIKFEFDWKAVVAISIASAIAVIFG